MTKLDKNHVARSPYEPTEKSDGSQRNSRKEPEAEKAPPKKKAAKKKAK